MVFPSCCGCAQPLKSTAPLKGGSAFPPERKKTVTPVVLSGFHTTFAGTDLIFWTTYFSFSLTFFRGLGGLQLLSVLHPLRDRNLLVVRIARGLLINRFDDVKCNSNKSLMRRRMSSGFQRLLQLACFLLFDKRSPSVLFFRDSCYSLQSITLL